MALSIPAVTGPYTSVNCTLSLTKSTIRKSPLLRINIDNPYARNTNPGEEDLRFTDYFGKIQSIVTSSAQNDSGMFEVNLHDERILPFEGAGAESTWNLTLPGGDLKQFNYDTISDVILNIRYTAREAGDQVRKEAQTSITNMIKEAKTSGLVRLFSLRHDFPNEWHKFASSVSENFQAMVRKDFFPYFAQGFDIKANSLQLYKIENNGLVPLLTEGEIINLTQQLESLNTNERQGVIEVDRTMLDKEIFLLVEYTLS